MRYGDAVNFSVLSSSFPKFVESLLGDCRDMLTVFKPKTVAEKDIHGQPQCLRNVIIVHLPSGLGNRSVGDEGAFEPNSGVGHVSRVLGARQELISCWNVIVGYRIW
jgi:hypothetical protein